MKKLLFMMMALLFILSACASTDESVSETNDIHTQEDQIDSDSQSKNSAESELQKDQSIKEESPQQEVLIEQDQAQLAKNLNLEAVTVQRVIDGDTVKLSDGRRVRLIGVNTPESTTRTEEYGKEASNYTTSKLTGKQVWLQKDVSEKDRYDRYLRIIWTDIPTNVMNESEIRTKMFNANLVINGYAEPSTYPPDVKYSEYFVAFAREAREKNTGLWAFGENGTTKGDLDGNNHSPTDSATKTENKDQHSTSSNTESFQNCTELRKVYPNGVPSDHPAYAVKHDRDKDNWACEK